MSMTRMLMARFNVSSLRRRSLLNGVFAVVREYEISQKLANFIKWPQILDKPMSGTLLSGKSPIRTQSVKKNPADGLKNQIATNF